MSISSVNSGDGNPTDMVVEVSQIQPLNRLQSPVTSHSHIVVETPSHYEAPAVPINIMALVESDRPSLAKSERAENWS